MQHQDGSQKDTAALKPKPRPTTKRTLIASIPIDLDEAVRREAMEKGRPISWVVVDWLQRGRRAPVKRVRS